ncbi:MAG: hypothetical protein S4CHLAM102_06860 [Chlamydiia bacterium]|nr:hypothetical protein [Chlamydiia bacterium]
MIKSIENPLFAQSVLQFVRNQIHTFVVGSKRKGLTSFLFHILDLLGNEGYVCRYIDLTHISTHRDFLYQLLSAFQNDEHLCLRQLNEEEVRTRIQDLLDELTNLGNKVVVALDEFQEITQLEDKGWLEATLRTHFQRIPNVSFLFTGSRKGLISEMLNDPERPFYRSCQIIEFPM